MLVWYFVIAPTVHAADRTALQMVLSVSASLADLLALLGVTALLLRCPRGGRRRPLELLAVATSVMIVGDLIWAHQALAAVGSAGRLHGIFSLMQYALLGAAAVEELRRPQNPHEGMLGGGALRPFYVLPYAAVLAGYGLLLGVGWVGADTDLFQLMLGAMLLTGLVLTRQLVAVRENVRLSEARTLLASEARFRSLIQNASDIVSILDPNGRFTYVSPSASQTLGYGMAHLLNRRVLDLVHEEDVALAGELFAESLRTSSRPITGRWRLRRADGTWIQTDNICTNLSHDATIQGVVLNTRDVSEQCALEAQLIHQAFHDPLTGMANRALFENRVAHGLSVRGDGGHAVAVLFVDLDHFKTINDSLGHAVGDALLTEAAARLCHCLRSADTVARLGGDEFAVLIENTTRDEVTAVADRIAKACLDPFWVDGHELLVSASIGVALAVRGQSAQELLRNADLAMYLAKSRGRGQAAVFEPEMHRAALQRLELVADLRHSLEREELAVVYQPIHTISGGAIVGVEALLRWRHPVRGAIAPATFIPIAEETGQIVSIGRWVLERACRDVRQLQEVLGHPLQVTVNLSARQLTDPTLVSEVQSVLASSQLAPGTLILELTEGTLFEHTDHILSVMKGLKASGVNLAIDDFGTGYSSLSYLQRLPIDILKIDRAFVDRIDSDTHASAVASVIVGLGKSLSLRTVAEGIETESQARALSLLGCDLGQGYLFSAPMAPTDLEDYARRPARGLAA
jgi:diguanylate cyclase (GGDEF)-like protein/PAS domain S-box-containing protein